MKVVCVVKMTKDLNQSFFILIIDLDYIILVEKTEYDIFKLGFKIS